MAAAKRQADDGAGLCAAADRHTCGQFSGVDGVVCGDRINAGGRRCRVDVDGSRASSAAVADGIGGDGAKCLWALAHGSDVGACQGVAPGAGAAGADAAGVAADGQCDAGEGFGCAANSHTCGPFGRVDGVVSRHRIDAGRSRRCGIGQRNDAINADAQLSAGSA